MSAPHVPYVAVAAQTARVSRSGRREEGRRAAEGGRTGPHGPDSLHELRLHMVRWTAAVVSASMALRQVLAAPADEPWPAVLRSLLLVYGLHVFMHASERSVRRDGLLLLVLIKLGTTVKALAAPDGEVVIATVAFGANRILPIVAAVVSGVRTTLVLAVWSVVDLVAVFAYKRTVALSAAAGDDLARAGASMSLWADWHRWYVAHGPREEAMLFTEVNYIAISTVVACVVVHHYGDAVARLQQALLARQRFIRDMVRAPPPPRAEAERGMPCPVPLVRYRLTQPAPLPRRPVGWGRGRQRRRRGSPARRRTTRFVRPWWASSG